MSAEDNAAIVAAVGAAVDAAVRVYREKSTGPTASLTPLMLALCASTVAALAEMSGEDPHMIAHAVGAAACEVLTFKQGDSDVEK